MIHRSISVVLLGACLISPTTAHALDPVTKCQDGAGKASASYFQALMKAAQPCFAGRADGSIGTDTNCFTNKAHPAKYPDVVSDDTLQMAVLSFDTKLNDLLVRACGPGEEFLPTAVAPVDPFGFQYPCSTNENIYYTSNLLECLIFRAHGSSAARIQTLIYNDAEPIADFAVRSCQSKIAKGLTGMALKLMKARRSCGRKIMAGKTCDAVKLEKVVASSLSKTTSALVSGCGPAMLELPFFGGVCGFTDFPTAESAAACLTVAVRDEAWLISDLAYRLE